MESSSLRPSLARLRDNVYLAKRRHGGQVCRVSNVQPIGNHTAGRVYDVQRLRVLLCRIGKCHAVAIGVIDGRSIDGDVLRSGCCEADRALYVLNDVAAAG